MPQHTVLLGAETVQAAGRAMQDAADTFARVGFDSSVEIFRQTVDRLIGALDDHATRIERAIRAGEYGAADAEATRSIRKQES